MNSATNLAISPLTAASPNVRTHLRARWRLATDGAGLIQDTRPLLYKLREP